MNDLIAALVLVISVAGNIENPTVCEHDVLYLSVSPELFTSEQIDRLDELGFTPDLEMDNFKSFRFGN